MSGRNKRMLVLVSAVLVLVVGAVGVTAYNNNPTPDEILTQTAETLDAAQSVHAVVRMAGDTPDGDGWARVEIWGEKPADESADAHPKFRVEVVETSKAEAAGALAVSNGENIWMYAPAKNTVWTGSVEEMEAARDGEHDLPFDETPQGFVDWLTTVSEVTLVSADQEAYALQFVPSADEFPEAAAAGVEGTMQVDQTRSVPLQFAVDGGSMGQQEVTVESIELDANVSNVSFTFTIPEGAEVKRLEDQRPQHLTLSEAEAAVDFELLMPADTIQDSVLVDVLKIKDTIVLRYESSQGPFAVSQGGGDWSDHEPSDAGQSVDLRGTTGTVYTNDAGTKLFLTWSEDGRAFVVAGEISQSQALQIAESLQ